MNHLLKSPRTLARTAALALIAALALAVLPAIGAQASDDDVTWTVRTASNQFGAERTAYNYAVNPGQTVDDALVVSNHGATPVDLGVYAADGYTTESGQFDLLVAGAKSVGVGAWVAGGTDHVTVAAGQSVEYPFTLTVPANATPGDYSGGIVTTLTQPDDANGINVDRRLGVKITLRVGGDLKPSLAIENMHVDWNGGLNPFAGGDATVSYTLHNTGNAVVSAQQAATVSGPFGWFALDAGTLDAPPQLLPGETWNVSVPVRDVPAEFWLTASASVVPVVIDSSGSTTNLDAVTSAATGPAIPWMLLVIILVIVALIILAVRLRRRAASHRQAREDARVKEAVDLALEGSR
ncbi:WxL protein peptidoglycan domain-containing protein [Subtercola endophyticus]|uniref:WxL protein peptidoglycan domain-containing protein n=1 Tax=Subtercola endophyticus TaxID=2895559 RepID=UPI001E2DF5E1|nr:DUF916 domain-containing protein [Subtercola endophyticus]UFS60905.1 DUF916 domain-containing protein [Subtercola endophyticus]